MNRRLASVAAAWLACAVTVGSAGAHPTGAVPAEEPCSEDYCVGDQIDHPGTPGMPAAPAPRPRSGSPATADPASTGGGGPNAPTGPVCTWERNPQPIGRSGNRGEPGPLPDVGSRNSPDDYLVFEVCDGAVTARARWASPTDPSPAAAPGPAAAATPTPPTPEQLAARVRVRLAGNLPRPTATTSPVVGQPAIVNHPTFLAIDDWTDTVVDQECAFLLCVTVTATAQLAWDPGEPGATTITCAAGGTTYDPTGPPAADQAATPGACAHAYTHRTSADGRPTTWPGTATVTWSLTWSSTAGARGTLTPVTRTIDLPRAVDEVQAIVVQ